MAVALAAGALAVGASPYHDPGQHPVLIYAASVGIICLSLLTGHMRDRSSLFSRRARMLSNYLGDISYPLYVMHMPTMIFLLVVTRSANVWIYVAGSLVAAMAVFELVDQRFKRTMLEPVLRNKGFL